jgi:hypothetical protein
LKNLIAPGLASLALIFSQQQAAFAVERLSAAELASHCVHVKESPDSNDGIFCIRYIQGFIDGAVATDERVTMNVADEYDREESFAERATRIRLGQRLASYGSYYAEFCLGEPVPLAEVVDRISTALTERQAALKTQNARDFVYTILRDSYPCDPDDGPKY